MKYSVSELRSKLSQALDLVKTGEVVDIEQRGKIVAQIMPFNEKPGKANPESIKGVRITRPTLAELKEREKRINDLLRGVNRKSR